MKYKIGDRVLVKPFDWRKASGGTAKVPRCLLCFFSDRRDYFGKEATIESVTEDFYRLSIDNLKFEWVDELLENVGANKHDRGEDIVIGYNIFTRKYFFSCGNRNFCCKNYLV